MHTTSVVLKSGEKISGPIYLFRPKEGYLTLMATADPQRKLFFRDMVSCVTENERISYNISGDQDELARAREQGWDGT